jgi:predicted nucleic acid-binding protein
MLAVDSSTVIAYIQDDRGEDVELFDQALNTSAATLPSVVLTEVLSDAGLSPRHRELVLGLPTLPIADGYWIRAAFLRATLIQLRLRARLADTLVAQSCIDHDVALITRDTDFRAFAKHCGLKLA